MSAQAQITDRSVHDGASSAPLHGRDSSEVSRKRRNELGIVRYFRETAGPGRPDPWLNRKFAVLLLIAIAGWSAYVFIGRICVPVFQGTSQSRFSVATAGGLLGGYIVVCFFLFWSYIRIITAGPGWAKDRVPQSDRPIDGHINYPQQPLRPISEDTSASHAEPRLDHTWTGATTALGPSPHTHIEEQDGSAPEPSEFAPTINALRSVLSHSSLDQSSHDSTSHNPSPPPPLSSGKKQNPDWRTVERPLPDIFYGPRWCRFCLINKPDRTHHCRHCGTCVMQFDHHCPWIGQCVGWGNHKVRLCKFTAYIQFFMTFNLWAIIYWFYHLIPLVIYLTQADIDGQVIGVIALAGLFGIFTSMMLFQHAYLIVTGKSTVEAFAGRDQHERESHRLNAVFGFWSLEEKKLVRRKWEEDFGGTSVDDRWRAGTRMDMWRREMGEEWYGWILPIGRPLGDGVHFPSNPRFGPNGEWLMKRDWPKGIE